MCVLGGGGGSSANLETSSSLKHGSPCQCLEGRIPAGVWVARRTHLPFQGARRETSILLGRLVGCLASGCDSLLDRLKPLNSPAYRHNQAS